MSPKLVLPHLRGADTVDYVLGVTEEFDDLAAAELAEVEKVRQPTTRRTDGHGPVGETG